MPKLLDTEDKYLIDLQRNAIDMGLLYIDELEF